MMEILWTIEDMLAAMNGRLIGDRLEGITGISIDSRDIEKGMAFFAIKGDQFDGHDFLSAARMNGAGVLVISEEKLSAMGAETAPVIVVEDVLKALEALGRAARNRVRGKIIAITGSVGKTTTKEMLRTALISSGNVHASVASFNNHWGVPLTLARMPQNTDFGVFEIGMNHHGEIRLLVDMVRPDVALITGIEAAHIGNFNNLEEIADAKAEIIEGVGQGGSIVLNRDNDLFYYLDQKAHKSGFADHVYSYGRDSGADFRLISQTSNANCSCFTIRIDGKDMMVKLGALGDHLVQNALAVLGICWLIDADMARASLALADFSAEKGRGVRSLRKIGKGEFTLIDESYNANPASMRAGISLLASTEPAHGGRRIAVLGDMLEMGRFSEKLHIDLVRPLEEAGVDIVVLSGAEMYHLAQAMTGNIQVYYQCDQEVLITWLVEKLRHGDVVMVKASFGIGFGKIVRQLQEKFPERKPSDKMRARRD